MITTIKLVLLLLHNCHFATVMNHNVISVFSDGLREVLYEGFWTPPPKGVTTNRVRTTHLEKLHRLRWAGDRTLRSPCKAMRRPWRDERNAHILEAIGDFRREWSPLYTAGLPA